MDRRRVLCSIAGLAVVPATVPFATEPLPISAAPDQEFQIVNGWMLTREDMAAREVTLNVV